LFLLLSDNISARVPGSNEFWITPSGIFKGELNPDDLVKLDLDGNIIDGFLRPSIEWPLHAAIYRVRQDDALVHLIMYITKNSIKVQDTYKNINTLFSYII